LGQRLYPGQVFAMQYQIFVQTHAKQGFVASVVGMPSVSVEGTTEDEAIAKVKTALEAQLATGKLVTIEVADEMAQGTDPWIKNMGIFADDPTFDDFLKEVEAYRQQVEE
jgi:predicted RNase H-like HicB family nuclease